MAKRDRNHEIGELAIDIINRKRPSNFVSRELGKDYGIDLNFEVFHELDDVTTGIEFGVQSKGTRSLKFVGNREYVTCPDFKVANLIDHVDKRIYPVFLFRVDVNEDKVYWVCLQKYAKQILDHKNTKWRDQESITIRLLSTNVFPSALFLDEVEDAVKFVRDLHPSSLSASAGYERQAVEEKDNRFGVDFYCKDGQISRMLYPKSPVELKLNISGHDAVEAMQEFFESGESASFEPGQFKLEGSRLFERANREGKLSIRKRASQRINIQINFCDEQLRTVATALLPDAKTVVGTKQVKIETSKTDHPMLLTGIVTESNEFRVELNINFGRWVGKRLMALPYFNVIEAIFSQREKIEKIEFDLLVDGASLSKETTNWPSQFDEFGELYEMVKKARELGAKFEENPFFTNDCDWDDIIDLHWLTFDRSTRPQPVPFVKNLNWCPVVKKSFADKLGGWPIRTSIRQYFSGLAFSFFDTTISSPPYTLELDPIEAFPMDQADSQNEEVAYDEVLMGFRHLPETKVTAFEGNACDQQGATEPL